MGEGFSVWPAATNFFSEKGVGPKIHPSFSLTEETKPFRMAKPVWGAGKTILLEYFGVSTKAYQPAVGPARYVCGKIQYTSNLKVVIHFQLVVSSTFYPGIFNFSNPVPAPVISKFLIPAESRPRQ